jgi:hypothetical protein
MKAPEFCGIIYVEALLYQLQNSTLFQEDIYSCPVFSVER